MRSTQLLCGLVVGSALLVACQRDEGRTLRPAPSVIDAPGPTGSAEPTAPSTAAATTATTSLVPVDSTAPPSSVRATSTIDLSTSAPLTSGPAAPPTTDSIASGELLLGHDGIGTALFGADPDAATEYITSIIGSDTGDSGWVGPEQTPGCNGTEGRRVDWGVLSLVFSDESPAASGERHLSGWIYGFIGELGGEPTGLRTDAGVTLGSTVADLRAAYPEVSILEGEPGSNFPDSFYVNEALRGLITSTGDEGLVVVMYGGDICDD